MIWTSGRPVCYSPALGGLREYECNPRDVSQYHTHIHQHTDGWTRNTVVVVVVYKDWSSDSSSSEAHGNSGMGDSRGGERRRKETP